MGDPYISDRDLYWLAGFLEGEGSFMKPYKKHTPSPQISVSSVDEDVIARVAKLLGCSYSSRPGAQEGWQGQFYIRFVSYKTTALMRQLLPLMGLRRQEQIRAALAEVPTHYPNPCDVCGALMERPTDRITHGTQKYCPGRCKQVASNKQTREWRKKQRLVGAGYKHDNRS